MGTKGCLGKEVEPYNFDWSTACMRYDMNIVKGLINAMLRQALSDWKYIGERQVVQVKGRDAILSRAELCRFFNSTWFGDIVDALYPEYTQEAACEEIAKQNYSVKTLIGKESQIKRKRP